MDALLMVSFLCSCFLAGSLFGIMSAGAKKAVSRITI